MTALVERKPEVVLRVVVTGKPVGKGRARTVQRHGRPCTITPEKTALWENWVRQCALSAMGSLPRERFPLDEPVGLRVTFRLPKPKKPRFDAPHGTPDLDNLVKAIKDGLQLAEVYVDDARIVQLAARKIFAPANGADIEVLRWR